MIPYSNANNLPIYRLVCSTLTELGSIDETKIDSSISFWFNIYLHHHWTVIKPIAFHCFRTNWRLCELWPSGNECEHDNIAKVYWHLINPSSIPDFSGELGLNLALGLVTSCYGQKTSSWRSSCCWLGEGPWALVTPVKAIRVRVWL